MATIIDDRFEPGEYWIGDLCYVMHDEWKEVCSVICNLPDDTSTVAFKLDKGVKAGVVFTMYGDGTYLDNHGNDYGVDAGLIGVIRLSDISSRDIRNIPLGHVHTFDNVFTIGYDDLGMISIGDVEIFTGDYVEDVEEYEEYDSEN